MECMAGADDFPSGYTVRNVNYGIELLGSAFPDHLDSLVRCLEGWKPSWDDVRAPGGNLSIPSQQFVKVFNRDGWRETEFELETRLQGVATIARTHKLDLFRPANPTYPGIGVELEWNNKDEFFDRDLINFEALHRARGLAVGIVMTRGPELQEQLKDEDRQRWGDRTTHWEKLVPRLDLGRGGATPIIAFGIEPDRIS